MNISNLTKLFFTKYILNAKNEYILREKIRFKTQTATFFD